MDTNTSCHLLFPSILINSSLNIRLHESFSNRCNDTSEIHNIKITDKTCRNWRVNKPDAIWFTLNVAKIIATAVILHWHTNGYARKNARIYVYMNYVNFMVKAIAFRIKYIGFIHKFIYRLYSSKHKFKLQFFQLCYLLTFDYPSLLTVTSCAVSIG